VTALEGDHLLVPEPGVHGFRNDSDAPASTLVTSTPGAPREACSAQLAEVLGSGRELWPEQWTERYARHDQEVVPVDDAPGSGSG
jgi:hypothetical protein